MHINEGAGMVNGTSGLNKEFIDEELPGTEGSIILAEWCNAITAEFRNVLLAAGFDLAATALVDREDGWGQLKQAIFESAALGHGAIATGAIVTEKLYDLAVTTAKLADGAVTDDKITDLDLAKVFGEMELSVVPGVGVVLDTIVNGYGAVLSYILNGTTSTTNTVSYGGIDVEKIGGKRTKFGWGGMKSVGIGMQQDVNISAFNLSDTGTWTTTKKWDGELTGLPKGDRILEAYITVESDLLDGLTAGDGSSVYDTPTITVVGESTSVGWFDRAIFTGVDSSENMQGRVYLNFDYNTTGTDNIVLYVVHG